MSQISDFLQASIFYGILDTGYVAPNLLFQKCSALAEAGCKIIQLRAKRESDSARREIAELILPIFKRDNAPIFIINDDANLAREICLKIPNAGLHIGQDDLAPKEARALIGENRALGLSTHSLEQALNADALSDTLDYFAVGPVYKTNTKPERADVGIGLVEKVANLKTALPWFAIGGINMNTAQQVRKAGAKRIVAVSDVLIPADTTAAVNALRAKFLG